MDDSNANPVTWYGWQLEGRDLVSPDGHRITEARLRGLIWRDRMELLRAGFISRRQAEQNRRSPALARPRVKVIVVDLAEYRQNGLAAS